MGVFRSEKILHQKIRMPWEFDSAVRIMDSLGTLDEDTIEFIDLNKDDLEAKKNFAPMIKRCDDMDRKISNIEMFAGDFNEKIYRYTNYKKFLQDLESDQERRNNLRYGSYFDVIESEIQEEEKKIVDLVESFSKIKEDLEIELEKKLVFDKYFQLVHSGGEIGVPPQQGMPMPVHQNENAMELGNGVGVGVGAAILPLLGVIKAQDDLKMKRMIFRVSRGRAISTFFDFIYPEDYVYKKDKGIEKKIFIIFYPSDGREVLYTKLLHICDLFGTSRYLPPTDGEALAAMEALWKTIQEKRDYLREAEYSIKNYMKDKFGTEQHPGKLELSRVYFKKEKMIFNNLNKCLMRENFIDGEVWVVEKHLPKLRHVLNSGIDDSDSKGTFIELVDAHIQKPTFIHSNEFIYPFQYIVNTYGIPRYQEINPAYFNIITFPFLFGIMFGDIGHGLILLLIASYLCYNADEIKTNKSSNLKFLVKVRYLFLLLGMCSFFCGWMYNDFFSIPLPIFGTCYVNVLNAKVPYAIQSNPKCVYPFGLDPKWYTAKNELAFFNSLKMKLSVIFGISQMIFGICLKGLNDIHFRNFSSFLFEFIPQLVFMTMLFGYMNIMIIIKWCIDWTSDLSRAPSLIVQMMNIILKLGSVAGMPLWGDKDGDRWTQENFHLAILITCLVLVPIMLIPKPLITYFKPTVSENVADPGFGKLAEDRLDSSHHSHSNAYYSHIHKPFAKVHKDSLIELFLHQSIETIEFILGTISNTASYLRLWALSLAHAELSKVFFEKTLFNQIMEGNFIYGFGFLKIFIGFFVFANLTFFILMCMDFMECFLHTLRLHWVEFQNKFFKADGYLFTPYSFKYLIETEE